MYSVFNEAASGCCLCRSIRVNENTHWETQGYKQGPTGLDKLKCNLLNLLNKLLQ